MAPTPYSVTHLGLAEAMVLASAQLWTIGAASALCGALGVGAFSLWRRLRRTQRDRRIDQARDQVLEALVKGREQAEVFRAIVELTASVQPRVSLLLLTARRQLRWADGTGLPDSLRTAEEVAASEDGIPCARAAATGQYAESRDLLHDPRWLPWLDALTAARIQACWAAPIRARDGGVLGSLNVYSRQARPPLPKERAMLEDAAQLTSEAIEYRHAHERLRASEAHLAEAQRIAGMGSWRGDPRSGMVSWSEGMFRIFGWPADQPVALEDLQRLIHPEDLERLRREQDSAREGLRSLDTEYRIVRPDGAIRHVRESCTFGPDDQGQPAWIDGVVIDITDQKQNEQERLKLEREVLQTQRLESLGLLARGVAHDFNNLLLAIIGNAELAKPDLPSGSGARGCVEKIEHAAWRAANLAQQMLAYSGRSRFAGAELDLNRALRELQPTLGTVLATTTRLEWNEAPDLPRIQGDLAQIRQMLLSLVTNASEAVGDKPGEVRVSTGIIHADRLYLDDVPEVVRASRDHPLPTGAYAWFEVADNGCGMPPEVQQKIFDPFFTTKFTGRGLSLAAVLGMVRAHHGTLKVQSKVGEGSVFRILLPAARQGATAPASPPPPAQAGATERRRPSILVVEDEEPVRVVCERLLQHLGCDVRLAPDGPSALEQYKNGPRPPDAVLLDLTMPGLSGDQVFLKLRQIDPQARVILYSGFSETEANQKFADLGLAGFLQKPFSLSALEERLRGVLPKEVFPKSGAGPKAGPA